MRVKKLFILITALTVIFLAKSCPSNAKTDDLSIQDPALSFSKKYQSAKDIQMGKCPENDKTQTYTFTFPKKILSEKEITPIDTIIYGLSIIIANLGEEKNDFCIKELLLVNEDKKDGNAYLVIKGSPIFSDKEILVLKEDFGIIVDGLNEAARNGYRMIRDSEDNEMIGDIRIILGEIRISREKIRIIFYVKNVLENIRIERF